MTDALRVTDVIAPIEEAAPPEWADDWDNVGLQLGHPDARAHRAAVALEVTPGVLQETLDAGADLLITHHPLIFTPLRQLRGDCPAGDRLLQLAGAGVAVYCAHTNLDRSRLGPSAMLAEELDLEDVVPLEPVRDLNKLVVYVPRSHLEEVRLALGDAGAGSIGQYSHCTFNTGGTGTFKPGAGTDPFLGSPGELTEVDESRLETVLPRHRISRVLATLYRVHPYEEPAFDLFPMDNRNPQAGMGRIGNLAEPVAAAQVIESVVQLCGAGSLRAAGDLDRRVQRVAVCGGAGEKLGKRAAGAGAEMFITGDVSHHGAWDMLDRGLIVLDAGHAATEQPIVARLASYLTRSLGPAVEILEMEAMVKPWK